MYETNEKLQALQNKRPMTSSEEIYIRNMQKTLITINQNRGTAKLSQNFG